AGDRLAARAGVGIGEDRVLEGPAAVTVARLARLAQSFALVPAIVGAGFADVDLLPFAAADVVDVEGLVAVVRVERDAERVAQPRRVDFPARLAVRALSRERARFRACVRERVVSRRLAVPVDPENLAEQEIEPASVRVAVLATAAREVAFAIADRHVQIAVAAEFEIAALV